MLAPLIAIVGADGSGKSTLALDMVGILRAGSRVEGCYLGLGSGEIGARIKRLPIVGRAMERSLSSKAARTRSAGERIPGLGTALVIYGFSLLRQRRFERMLTLRRSGVTVITDRYPQIEVPGFYDGPGLSAAEAGSPLVAWLAARERRLYDRMAAHRPTLVLRLEVDLATAAARKPDHDVALLARKIAVTPSLRFGGARIVDLDSHAPYALMRRRALEAIRAVVG
jgi:energy-coupling factor transporter ATP-binding protein EcfA2